MSDLTARIVEVLRQHPPAKTARGGVLVCGCGQRGPVLTTGWLRHHQAEVIAELVREAQAEAWDRYDAAFDEAWKQSEEEPWEYIPANPYKEVK